MSRTTPKDAGDSDSRDFWAGLAEGRLVLQQCLDCGAHRFPPMPGCPDCGSIGHRSVTAAGSGTIYSWVVVHRAFDPAFSDEVPYTVLAVDLDEGPRINARLEKGMPAFDARVAAVFVRHAARPELRFRLTHG